MFRSTFFFKNYLLVIPVTEFAVVEGVLACSILLGDGDGVAVPAEGRHPVFEEVHVAVGVVGRFVSQLLQLLPDDQQSVDVRVVQEEDGVVRRVLQRRHGISAKGKEI